MEKDRQKRGALSLALVRRCRLILLLSGCLSISFGQNRHGKTSTFMSYKGLIMAGYQGWFNAPEDGSGRGWNHYRGKTGFKPGSVNVDLWPDVSEYKITYKTPFQKADGSPAYVFSPHDSSAVNLHFKWMKEYGVDGVFVQRFVTNLKSKKGLNANNVVLNNVVNASTTYHRAIAMMYDMSGMEDDDAQVLINDWKQLVDSLHLTGRGDKQNYLYHNGKPLVALWGVGFSDHRAYHLSCVEKIMDFLKNDPVYGGCSILLGVPTYWRDFGVDTENDPKLHNVLRRADIIHPWFVGRYNEVSYQKFQTRINKDIAWCKTNQVDYVPVVFPGFSWHNMNPGSPQNQIPRNRGLFYWKQLSGAIHQGAEMIYVAMFDEIDEGTAIFKISKNPPVGESTFVTLEDDIPNDYYLFLTGYAGKILKHQIPVPVSIPLPLSRKL